MKKLISWLLVLAMAVCMLPLPSAAAADDAEDKVFVLPVGTVTVGEEAFAGNTGMTTLVVPKYVESIGARAFAGCTQLREVYLGKNESIEIAKDAFAGCEDVHFYVYPHTPGELFALSHGYVCDLLEEGSSFFDRAISLVAENGGTSILQSGEFASKRLIAMRSDNRLPDVSAYEPTGIVQDGDIFVLQFDTVDHTADCYTYLANDAQTVFVEADECVAALDEVNAAGVVDGNVWDTDDPMGFDVYAPFIAENDDKTGPITIAIIDSGVAKNSAYNRRLRNDGYNMLWAQEDTDPRSWDNDLNRHGSVIASVINDCVGDANVQILPIRVVGASGNTDFILLGNAIKYAVEKQAKIINMSLNFKESAYVTKCLNDAINNKDNPVTVVVAAGNAGRNITNVYPANVEGVVTVSGLSSNYQLSANSNYGAGIDYCAPDSYVRTSAYSNSMFNGTSFATPMIASALALVELDPYHSVSDMDAACYLSNDTNSPANSYGKGMPQLAGLADVPVTGLAFSSSLPGQLAVGDQLELAWVIEPSNATNKAVSVVSSDESVIAISSDENGNVFMNALAQGTATLTATSASTGVQVSRTFTVVQPVTQITISGGDDHLAITKTMKLTAVITPEDATTKNVEWHSTNEAIATVDQNGLVRPVSLGTVGVYCTALDGYGAQSDVLTFEVREIPDAEGIVLRVNGEVVTDSMIQMVPGQTLTIVTQVLPEDADQSVSFRVLGNYVTVSDTGVVTAVSPGTAYVIVSTTDNKSSAELQILVAVPPESVTISGETVINEGESVTLTATVSPENTTDKSVSWSSSDTSVATVTSGGVVTGVHDGSAIITAKCNADNSVKATVMVTVRHPYTLVFNTNTPEAELVPTLDYPSKGAYSDCAVGALPNAICNYYYFLGWFTEPSGGTQVLDTSVLKTTDAQITVYAHWQVHEESGWVLVSAVPTGARITQTSYSYRESTESTSGSMSGWISNGSYWSQTGTGSKEYASFPSTYKTSHSTYTSLNGTAYEASETETYKREVVNTQAGYVYWHWAYNVAYANNTNRWISDRKQTAGASRNLTNYAYSYFYAFKSTTNATKFKSGDFTYTWGANAKYNSSAVTYNCASCLPSGADKSAGSGLATPRFLRLTYYKSTYTDYQKIYKYYRDLNYQSTDPGSGGDGITITNKVTYVKYRPI